MYSHDRCHGPTDYSYIEDPCWHGLSIRRDKMVVVNAEERNSMSARACNAYTQ